MRNQCPVTIKPKLDLRWWLMSVSHSLTLPLSLSLPPLSLSLSFHHLHLFILGWRCIPSSFRSKEEATVSWWWRYRAAHYLLAPCVLWLHSGVNVQICHCVESGILVHRHRFWGPAGSVDHAVAWLEVAAGPVHHTSGNIYYLLLCECVFAITWFELSFFIQQKVQKLQLFYIALFFVHSHKVAPWKSSLQHCDGTDGKSLDDHSKDRQGEQQADA